MVGLSAKNYNFEKRRSESMRTASRTTGTTQNGGVYGGQGAGGSLSFGSDNSYADRQYAMFRDIPYSAIRPICVRFASQPIRIAITPVRQVRGQESEMAAMRKSLRSNGYIADRDEVKFNRRQRVLKAHQPLWLKQSLPPDAVVLDSHEVVDALQNSNDILDGYRTQYLTAASLMLAGKALVMWDRRSPTTTPDGQQTPGVFYIPIHWAEPRHNNGPFSGWTIKPPQGGEAQEISKGEFVYMTLPDPRDPLSAVSPTQAQAKTINTGDKIHDAHYHGLNNLIRPSYAISMGRVPDGVGGTTRPYVKRENRRKITDLVKSYVQGVMNRGEPILLDALIDDIKDIGTRPTDLDYANGSDLVERRMMQGYGVSPIVAGFSQSANRAGSAEAHSIFYQLVVNPLLSLAGSAYTHAIGPQYSNPRYKITIYFDAASADDEDAKRSRVMLFKDRLSAVESRRYMRTGELDYQDEDVAETPTNEVTGGTVE